jgi:hypothetical protein
VLKPGGHAVVSVYYRNRVLRSRLLSRLTAFALSRVVSLPGRGRDRLLQSGDPNEIVRLYDGRGNPLGKAYTGPEIERMFRQSGFAVIGHERYYLPARAFGRFGWMMRGLQPMLARHFGLLYTVFARRLPAPPFTREWS